jgi:hypothetical protein
MRSLFLTALVLAIATVSVAQHVPDEQVTKGDPETVLSGIDVYHNTLKQIIATYGKPTSEAKDPQGLPLYIWEKPGIKMQVGTDYDNPEKVYAVHVWGAKPVGKLGVTGKGLALGCDIACVKKIYGERLIQHHPDESMLVFIEGTELTVGFDDHGHINHLAVVGEVE